MMEIKICFSHMKVHAHYHCLILNVRDSWIDWTKCRYENNHLLPLKLLIVTARARFRGIILEGSKFQICCNAKYLCHIQRTMHHLQESLMQLLLFCSLQADPLLVAVTRAMIWKEYWKLPPNSLMCWICIEYNIFYSKYQAII
jgi:hypothetical protein